MLASSSLRPVDGMGGRECFDPAWSWPVEAGDIVGFATAAQDVLTTFHQTPHILQEKARTARDFVAREYSKEREERDVLTFWDDLMFEHGRDAIAEIL